MKKSTAGPSRPDKRIALITRLRKATRISFLPTGYRWLPGLALVFLLTAASCRSSTEGAQLPDIPFNAAKWRTRQGETYPYRKQMVADVLKNYQLRGASRNSVIRFLGTPDSYEEGNLRYDYAHSVFLGGIGTSIDAVVVELGPDSTVRQVRLNDGGFD